MPVQNRHKNMFVRMSVDNPRGKIVAHLWTFFCYVLLCNGGLDTIFI